MSEYYVNPTGDDEADGSLGTPWETIGKANTTLTAGDTVYIMDGTYVEAIAPDNSGTSGNPITYASYDINNKGTINAVFDGADLDGRSYITLDGLAITNCTHYWVSIHNTAEYNIIKNCYMSNADGWGGIHGRYDANYSQVLDNEFYGVCNAPVGGPSDAVMFWSSHHCLIEGNTIDHAAHAGISFDRDGSSDTAYHVIRNNIVFNPWHTNIAMEGDMGQCLFEGNIITDAGTDRLNNACGSQRDRDMDDWKHKSIQLANKDVIIRNNIFIDNGSMTNTEDSAELACYNLRCYNNTFHSDIRAIFSAGYGGPSGNIYKNNIIHGDEYAIDHSGLYTNIHYFSNDVWGGIIDFAGQGDTDHWNNNIASDPEYVDIATRDMRLKAISPCINAGEFLTQTNGTGTDSTTLIVNDATYFMDGWGIVTGDTIQLEGQETTAVITDITANTITLATALTWTDDLGVSLPYVSTAPDIGAWNYTDPLPDPPADGAAWIEAEAGVISLPMVITADVAASGGYYVSSPTANVGLATFEFNLTDAGTYKIEAEVYAAEGGSDSMFFSIDGGSEYLWDMNPEETDYGVYRSDEVTSRGTGTYDAPQYDPFTIALNSGDHNITFRGRETNARLDRFQFVDINDSEDYDFTRLKFKTLSKLIPFFMRKNTKHLQ